MSGVPADILDAINSAAKDEWPDNEDMQDYYIESEVAGYTAIANIDFGVALPFKDRILEWAMEYSSLWEERASFIEDEISSYVEMHNRPDDIPADVFDELKSKASADKEWFSLQGEVVNGGMQRFRYIRDTHAEIVPIRDLLIRMEAIIGNECYNSNIQNYSSWGVWEGEGRSFRYPVTFLRNDKVEKRKVRFDDLMPEELVTGYYRFGANELSIYRALLKIIDMLEEDYGLQVSR